MTYGHLLTRIDDTGVNRISLDRPGQRNALNAELVAELKDALGEGPDFCAGADLREVQESIEAGVLESLADAESLGELFLLLRKLRKPVVAAVHGRALAGGCGLATACDLVVAASDSQFGYPEVRLGFVPAMVMAILRRSVGEKRAFELVALGDRIDAATAREYGLVSRVFPAEAFDAHAEEFAVRLAERSASALALSKELLYQIDGMSFEAAIRTGAEVNAIARLTPDCQEGIRRFLER
jgi:methylglutaconyl-CoA hydratase